MLLLPDIEVEGEAITVKSLAFVPKILTVGLPESDSVLPPKFSIVKVRTSVPEETLTKPKSVWSVIDGLVSPFTMETLLPLILISGNTLLKVNGTI